ncbi:hypothetical protein I6F35_02745 [Bradyrhizobium sp. BRP22]|uniref:hypothetical protein n=1 Tax=Bradyrhizobium sp. BRP22 TaxID=2793821 RepID=UPI001CD357F7|nr:hypothetical protein [Bradyrhizobium sp. BRP22]MCA1452132.1 hypothetical protein [Bradyrhizobium sp. BRP22]
MTEKEISLRKQRQNERLAKLRAFKPKGVRVVPASDELRKVLKHPNGMGFRPEGSSEWPNDRFTKRRIADGSVTLEQSGMKSEEKPPPRRYSQRSEPNSAA